jgi:probable RNA-binding protein EIF1AD
VEPIVEGDKVKAEIVRILTSEHVKFFQDNNQWPEQFIERKDNKADDRLFVNTNRLQQYRTDSTSSSDGSNESCCDGDDDDDDDDDDDGSDDNNTDTHETVSQS